MGRRKNESSIFTAEFGSELEAHRQVMLRRRFLWYTGTVATVNMLALVRPLFRLGDRLSGGDTFNGSDETPISAIILSVTALVLYVVAWTHVRREKVTRWPLLKITTWLIVASGSLTLISGAVTAIHDGQPLVEVHLVDTLPEDSPGAEPQQSPDPARVALEQHEPSPTDQPQPSRASKHEASSSVFQGGWGVLNIFLTHFLACAFLPWTARESMRPVLPLLIVNAGVTLAMLTFLRVRGETSGMAWFFAITIILLSPLVAAPGAALCWWRHSQFRDEVTTRLVRGRYAEMRRELTDARRIHESLFPKLVDHGPVTFSYVYEPMRQIGGDFLYVHRMGDGRLHLVVMDVTGHGIPAALTVNRLHGELQRLFAEEPEIAPGDLLRLLNRYVNLTMADLSLFVTAMCLRADPKSAQVQYASAGHPPAYLRTADGRVHELPATTFLLGACSDAEFDPAQAAVDFMPGDRVAAFTDGAIEARGVDGRMIGLAGMRALVAGIEPHNGESWSLRLLRAVESMRSGPPADDTLVVEIVRVLAYSEASAKPKHPSHTAVVGR